MTSAPDDRHATLLASLGERAVAALGHRPTPNAEGLRSVFHRAARYLEPDPTLGVLVVTRRSLVFAMIEEGRLGSSDMTNGHAAGWLTRWLDTLPEPRFPDPTRYEVGLEALEAAVARGPDVPLDADVVGVLEDAARLARDVRAPDAPPPRGIALRHLMAVCLKPVESGGVLGRVGLDVNRPLGAAGLQDARADFLTWVTRSLTSTERASLWAAAMAREGLLEASGDGVDRPPLVTTFAPDRPASELDGPDPMRIDKDVTAFARLIAHQGAATPLAIGVFGAWGSGKSTFMERLEKSIDRLAQPGRPDAGKDGFVSSVVHIRFNAWSFADANLWASLGAEFFDQLRVGGHSKRGSHIHASLVERVTTHVHDLRSTAEATRAVAHEGERDLARAQQDRDKAVKSAREGATVAGVTQGLLDGMARAHEAFKGEFGGQEDDLARLITTARNVQTASGRGLTALKLMTRGGWRTVTPVGLFAIGLAAAYGLHMAYPTLLDDRWKAATAALGPALLGALAAFGSGLRLAKRFAVETAGFARQLKAADADSLAKVLAAELALKHAADEADARRKAAERATRALSRYIDPKGTANPPRLLRYVLEDDPATRALEKEIGLISRTRRLFEAVDEILQEDRRIREAGGAGDRDTPERIVIYIDDLDRCTQEQVQSVLQAVHLLLAFQSFVVVVGVDQMRVAEAMARQFDDDDDPDNDSEDEIARRMDRAVLYLEKIFQLAFRLRPLSPAGEDGGAYGRFVLELTAPAAVESIVPPPETEPPESPPKPPLTWTDLAPTPEGPLQAMARQLGVTVPPPPPADPAAAVTPVTARQALETLTIEEPEARFLASVAIGTMAGTTPRNVKRMLNVYRLARVRLVEDGFDLTGKAGEPLYPLLALFAAIDTGRKPQTAKRVFDALGKDDTPLDAIVRIALPAAESPTDAVAVTDAVCAAFGRMPKARDCRPIAELVRRYSFNALDD